MSADRIRNPSFKFPPEAPYIQKPDRRKSRHADRIQSLSLDTLLVAIGLPLALALLWARAQGWLS